ncbi:hypothetical protein L1D32_02315 [Shewanella insulae]|uniref:hypothetical protein n=1 Tax=Shewanella insulae TaxID=2681496 RepID=UPI001EFCB043|nr:hypothetical protein [Shewanella insulae]MCG9736994.1 hypothetical protein [Shewanella insulae]
MHTRLKTPYRPERALLYALLMTTALLLLLISPAITALSLDPMVLFSLLLLLSCAASLLAISPSGKLRRQALGLIFGLWLLVWVSQGLLLPL